jgi:hypothetical protein
MLRSLLGILLTGIMASATAQAQAACKDPTPGDSAWWHWRQVRQTDDGFEMQPPLPPSQPRTFRLASLRGSFDLQLTPTLGPDRGQSIHARIELATDSTGSARASTEWPSYFSFAPESTASQRTQPLNVLFNAEQRWLRLIIGNPGLQWTDSGVILEVFAIRGSHITGRWVDGGLGVYRSTPGGAGLHPQGWFCLTQMQEGR